MGAVLMFLILGIVLSIFAAVDSSAKKIGFTDGYYTALNGWLGWLLLCIYLWPFMIPWYFIRRYNVMKPRGDAPSATTMAIRTTTQSAKVGFATTHTAAQRQGGSATSPPRTPAAPSGPPAPGPATAATTVAPIAPTPLVTPLAPAATHAEAQTDSVAPRALVEQADPSPAAAATGSDARATSVADEIEKLADLHAKGILTDEEFAALKAKLI